MPIYEYHCDRCETEFEQLIRGSEPAECPHCKAQSVEKLLSVPASPSAGGQELPMCRPMPAAGCGLPQCGMGGCGMS
jgi:putative FmdB family regulatory protein